MTGNRHWEEEEDNIIRYMFKAGSDDEKMATVVGRTSKAVASRRKELKLVRKIMPPRKEQGTADCHAELRRIEAELKLINTAILSVLDAVKKDVPTQKTLPDVVVL